MGVRMLKVLNCPITTVTNNTMNQSELKEIQVNGVKQGKT